MDAPSPACRPRKAIVIDDSHMVRKLLVRLLESFGFTVTGVADGEAGLREIAAGCDVVFLDLHMPGLTGMDVLQRIRTDPRHGGLPVVVVSGANDPASVSAALAAGADEYVMKPFDREVMLAKLALLRWEEAQ